MGAAVDKVLNVWEDKNRPYRIRTVTPENYKNPDVPAIEANDAATWRTLSEGRALLFVHGTFSTSHSGFGGLDTANIKHLHRNTNGVRIDHFTLSQPKQNGVGFQESSDVSNDVTCLHVEAVSWSGARDRQRCIRGTGTLTVGKGWVVGAARLEPFYEPTHGPCRRFTSALKSSRTHSRHHDSRRSHNDGEGRRHGGLKRWMTAA